MGKVTAAARRRWAEANREKLLEIQLRYAHSEQGKAQRAKYLAANKLRLYTNEYRARQEQKAVAYSALGGKCGRCGFRDTRALQIDHINGGGSRENKGSRNYYRRVTESVIEGEGKYQLLCANCNWIKRAENKEHR